MRDIFGIEQLHEYQEQARHITNLNERLEWLERKLKKAEMAREALDKNEKLKALYETANFWQQLAPHKPVRTVFEILPEEINRTKDLLLLEEIRENAEAKPDLQRGLFYLIECKTDDRLLNRLTHINEKDYKAYIDKIIKDMKTGVNNGVSPAVKPIKWKGNQAELITMFYDLLQCDLIEAKKTDIAKLITAVFVDQEGKNISYEYVYKLLKPDEEKSDKRADFSAFG